MASADATEFTLRAAQGEPLYTIGENQYLAKNASTLSYEVSITVGQDTWSYEESTILRMNEFDEPFAHTDRNTLRRAGYSLRPPVMAPAPPGSPTGTGRCRAPSHRGVRRRLSRPVRAVPGRAPRGALA